MEWSFKYVGPKSAIDDRACPVCSTVALKKCPDGHLSLMVGCTHCDAVRDGVCRSHCGISKALELHDVSSSDPLNFSWVTAGQTAKGNTIQERRETKMTQAKADRIRKAATQYSTAAAYVLAQCALLPECTLDVTLRGDDLNKICGIDIAINTMGAVAQEEDPNEPEVEAPQTTGLIASS